MGYFPKAWKHGKTIMVPKPGKYLSSAKNYRPISLLSCLGLGLDLGLGLGFERLLAGRISKYVDSILWKKGDFLIKIKVGIDGGK